MNTPKVIIAINLIAKIVLLSFFSCTDEKNIGDVIEKDTWQLKVISVKQQEVQIKNGGKVTIPTNIEIEFELAYNGVDSITIFPSDFVLVDSDGREFRKPAKGGLEQTISFRKKPQKNDFKFHYFVYSIEKFKLEQGEKVNKNFQYSISDSSKDLRFKFKNLPFVKIKI